MPFPALTRPVFLAAFLRLCIAGILLTTEAGPAFGATSAAALPSLAPMLEKVLPAVVNISTTSHIEIRENPLLNDPFFRYFFDLPTPRRRHRKSQSLGSGVIVDREQGLILTAHHVIDKADAITVTLDDGREVRAEVVGSDPESDVAVIRAPVENLTEIEMGDSDRLRIGDFVVAIGNPFGLSQTVTLGIVSGLGRSGLGIGGFEDYIQTDAPINPGNSGGALVDIHGRLIGINTAIIAPGGGNVGIGFAIPINMVRRLMEQIVEHGDIRRGSLGVEAQDLTPALARAFDLPGRRGAIISRVLPGSVADKGGLREGDVIVSVNGTPVEDSADLHNAIGLLRTGDQAHIEYLRDGRMRKTTLRIAAPRDGRVFLKHLEGALFSDVEPGFLRDGEGAVGVLEVVPGSPAWQSGLREGDLILSVNRQRIGNLDELREAAAKSDKALLLNILRGDRALFLVIQ